MKKKLMNVLLSGIMVFSLLVTPAHAQENIYSDDEIIESLSVQEFTLYHDGTIIDGNRSMTRATWQIPVAIITLYVSGNNFKYTIVPLVVPAVFSGTSTVHNRYGLSMGTVKHNSYSDSRMYYKGGTFTLSGTITTIIGVSSFTKTLKG